MEIPPQKKETPKKLYFINDPWSKPITESH